MWLTSRSQAPGHRRVGHGQEAARRPSPGKVLLRADSAFCERGTVGAAVPDDTWQAIEYIDALFDQTTKRGARPQRSPRFRSPRLPHGRRPTRSPGGSSVRRIPDLNPHAKAGQATLFQTWRFHAFFTTSTLDTVIADKTHRGHAIIEQVHADMKNSALAHLPSGIFNANAAWLVLAVMAVMAVMAFNLTRAAATLGGTTMAKATTATIRR